MEQEVTKKRKNQGIIPLFIPHIGCPHTCVFCNQHRIANDSTVPTANVVRERIKSYAQLDSNHTKHWEVAFYGGSFSALPRQLQQTLLEPAKEALDGGIIDGIRCSTRPDAVDEAALDFLLSYGVTTVELGAQAVEDEVLAQAERGHTWRDVVRAVSRMKGKGMTVGLQFMLGLPGQNAQSPSNIVKAIKETRPHFIRLYPVLVIEDTKLAESYRAGHYQPLSVEDAAAQCAYIKEGIKSLSIPIIRMGLQSTTELDEGSAYIAGPYAPAFGEIVVNYEVKSQLSSLLEKILAAHSKNIANQEDEAMTQSKIRIFYPRALTSKVRGLGNRNVRELQSQYGEGICWQEDNTIEEGTVVVKGYGETHFLSIE